MLKSAELGNELQEDFEHSLFFSLNNNYLFQSLVERYDSLGSCRPKILILIILSQKILEWCPPGRKRRKGKPRNS